MSITNDFRTAAGLRRWAVAAEDLAAADSSDLPPGPGLFEITDQDGCGHLTNVRKIAGRRRTRHAPGSVLIGAGGWLLAVLGSGLLFVSFAGQFAYLLAARHQVAPSMVAALMFDAGMIIFSLLALGLARAGKSARTQRALILACAFGSAAMNYAAADVASPRSVVAYVAPPLFLAVVVDQVVAVIRRHVLGDDETSPWAPLGRVLLSLVRLTGLVALYSLRLLLDPKETIPGLRRVVLNAAPLPVGPESPAIEPPDAEPSELAGASKKARLAWWYERDPDYGNRSAVAAVAKRLAPRVDLAEGTARAYLAQICADLEKAGEAS
jgi:Protein of unknown function (DUF2637)